MLINLNEAIQKAKENGATDNPGIEITIKLYPRWLAWILNKLYPRGLIGVWINHGEIQSDGFLHYKYHFDISWTTRNDTI